MNEDFEKYRNSITFSASCIQDYKDGCEDGAELAWNHQQAKLDAKDKQLTKYKKDIKQKIVDQDAVIMSFRRLTKELDIIWNGEDAAQQASLCDLVGQIENDLQKMRAKLDAQAEELAALRGFADSVHKCCVNFQPNDFHNFGINRSKI